MAKEVNDADAMKLEKLKILQSTLDKIEKSYGKGSIMKLGDRPDEQLDVISTGSISLDMALGVGGFPAAASLKSTVPRVPVRPPWPSMPSPSARRTAASPLSSTPSMPSTASMPRNWVWT